MRNPKGTNPVGRPRGIEYTTKRVLAAIGYPDSRLVDIQKAVRKNKAATFMALTKLCKLGLVVRVSHGRYRRVEDEAVR